MYVELGIEVGVWSEAARLEVTGLTKIKLNAPGAERPAIGPAELRKVGDRVRQHLMRITDGHYDGMSWAVATPRLRITPSGLFLDVEWATVVHSWNHPPLTSEATSRLAEAHIVPALPSDLEIRSLEWTTTPMTRGPAPGIQETLMGYRWSVTIPGGRRDKK